VVDALLTAPVIVKVLGALSIILVMNRLCRHLIVSVAVATLALALWCGHSAPAMAEIAWRRFFSIRTLSLTVIVFEVIWLSSQMSATGVMGDLVNAVRARVSRRGAVAVLPAVIGLLPMPGGALFSAPLVDSVDTDDSMSAGLKTQANHWFRHIWEYWWPLYPGVLLAMELTGLDVWQFMLLGVPLSLCAVAAGYVFLLRRIPAEDRQAVPEHAEASGRMLPLVLPIIVVIVGYAVVRLAYAGVMLAWPDAPGMNRYIPMAVGLVAAMLVLQRQRPLGRTGWRGILLSNRALNMAAIVAMVSVYGAFIEAPLPGGESLVAQMRGDMAEWGIPFIAIVMLLPLVSGLATGLAIGFVGASFPIVISLLGEAPPMDVLLSTTVLAYGFGFAGMLLSPVHVCLIVGSEYFKTRVLANAAGLLRPISIVLAASLAYHLLLRWLAG